MAGSQVAGLTGETVPGNRVASWIQCSNESDEQVMCLIPLSNESENQKGRARWLPKAYSKHGDSRDTGPERFPCSLLVLFGFLPSMCLPSGFPFALRVLGFLAYFGFPGAPNSVFRVLLLFSLVSLSLVAQAVARGHQEVGAGEGGGKGSVRSSGRLEFREGRNRSNPVLSAQWIVPPFWA